MNINAIYIGILVAFAIIRLFNVEKENDIQVLYSLYLANLSLYYWIFSLNLGSLNFLYQEILASLPFIAVTVLCYKINNRASMNLLAPAYLLHASYDFSHTMLFVNSGIPDWWSEFSGVINVVLGIYLFIFIRDRSNKPATSKVYGH